MQTADGRRQTAGGRRQEAGGRRLSNVDGLSDFVVKDPVGSKAAVMSFGRDGALDRCCLPPATCFCRLPPAPAV